MLRTLFIGSKNAFDQVLVHWLAQRTDLVGVIWTHSTAWQRSWQGRLSFTQKRLKRYGPLKILDELLFYLYYHTVLSKNDHIELTQKVIEPYWAKHTGGWEGDSIFTLDVNTPEVIAFLEKRKPDLALAMCINNYFGKKVRRIPKNGIFLWHEGITPEYKGLYSPFWAVHNLDFDRIGYTLLQMNDKYDAGTIYVQGQAHSKFAYILRER